VSSGEVIRFPIQSIALQDRTSSIRSSVQHNEIELLAASSSSVAFHFHESLADIRRTHATILAFFTGICTR
jgi:hypothetical protein